MDEEFGTAESTWMLQVTDIKQWAYCPRVVFFVHFMPEIRPMTHLMEEGLVAHEEEELREVRRSLRRYGLDKAERHLRVMVQDPGLGVSGRVDLVLRLTEEVIPVEYKLRTSRFSTHHRVQLAVYALLLERNGWAPVRRGFLYSIQARRAEEVRITARLRATARGLIEEIRDTLRHERLPAGTGRRARCVSCEYRRFCNDLG